MTKIKEDNYYAREAGAIVEAIEKAIIKGGKVLEKNVHPSPPYAKQNPLELHACMGLNACKGHGVFGTNDCAGKGHCATQVHYCHTLNNCRGQGGCGLFGTTEEQCRPGANDCALQGSCGTPIPASRFVTQGPNKGKSVWLIARALFEERMNKARRTYGPAPMRYGPTLDFLGKVHGFYHGSYQSYGEGTSCGQAGEKFCSFAGNTQSAAWKKTANARQVGFHRESARDLQQSLDNCKEGDDCC
ncbi:MAG: hypothetical protein AAFZ15_15945 [Bacteroidota bacterium]